MQNSRYVRVATSHLHFVNARAREQLASNLFEMEGVNEFGDGFIKNQLGTCCHIYMIIFPAQIHVIDVYDEVHSWHFSPCTP